MQFVMHTVQSMGIEAKHHDLDIRHMLCPVQVGCHCGSADDKLRRPCGCQFGKRPSRRLEVFYGTRGPNDHVNRPGSMSCNQHFSCSCTYVS